MKKLYDLYELTPPEIYSTFVTGLRPHEVAGKDRDDLAADLMKNHDLHEEDAYYAADQILIYADEKAGAPANPDTDVAG